MDHRTAGQSPNEMEAATVAFIRSHCGLLQFSEQLILHILGVIDTNAYIIGENQTKTVDIQGLFPVMSIINHSCLANTVCYARDDDSFVCRAVRDIKQGEEITTNYLFYQYHSYGRAYRARELRDHWHFSCSCARCGSGEEEEVDLLLCGAGCGAAGPAPAGRQA